MASPCETQPQQGSVISHPHRHGHWSRYLFKNFIDLFQKKSYHQSLRRQFLLISLSRLMTTTCNLQINHSRACNPPTTPPIGGLHVPLPDSPMQDSVPGSPGPPHDPPPPSPPPAGTPSQTPGTPMIHWCVAPQEHLHGCHRFQ